MQLVAAALRQHPQDLLTCILPDLAWKGLLTAPQSLKHRSRQISLQRIAQALHEVDALRACRKLQLAASVLHRFGPSPGTKHQHPLLAVGKQLQAWPELA